MANKKKIDNLSPKSSASEMEEAIKEFDTDKADPIKTDDEPEAKITEGSPKEPKEKESPAPVKKEEPAAAIADEFGGDYEKVKKSYKEAYAWNTRMAQDVAAMRKEMEELKAAGNPKTPAEPTITQEQFLEWHNNDPISANRYLAKLEANERALSLEKEIKGIKEELGGYLAQNAIHGLRSKYDDFANLEDSIRDEILKLPPGIADNPKHFNQVLETAYWTAKGRQAKTGEERARKSGMEEAAKRSQKKEEAFVEGAGKAVAELPINLKKASSKELYEYMKTKGVPGIE